jgi:hypothetical protein
VQSIVQINHLCSRKNTSYRSKMRISAAAWSLVFASSAIFTDAFTTPISHPISSKLSATIEREETAVAAPVSFQDVQNLAYRELQRHCKSVGLEAVGSTAVLRSRLLSHYGLLREKKFASIPDETNSEVEVRQLWQYKNDDVVV